MHHWEGEEQPLLPPAMAGTVLQGNWPSFCSGGHLMTCLSTDSVLYEFLSLEAEGSTSLPAAIRAACLVVLAQSQALLGTTSHLPTQALHLLHLATLIT